MHFKAHIEKDCVVLEELFGYKRTNPLFKQAIAKSALRALELVARADLTPKFYMAGGTAASIQIGHRLSVDLDYFSQTEFKSEILVDSLLSNSIDISNIETLKGTLHCVIENTKVSFLRYRYNLLFDTATFGRTDIASLCDIALMKMIAITSRGAKKDFIDLYFILQQMPLSYILDNFPKKYPLKEIDPYCYIKGLTYFDDAQNDPMPHMLMPCDWEEVKNYFQNAVRELVL